MGLQDPRGAPGEDVPRPVTQPIGRRPLPRNYSAPETLAFCTKGQMNWECPINGGSDLGVG